MRDNSRILFIQPPLLDHARSYIAGNVEYAGASLSAYIRRNFPRCETHMLPFILSNFASDNVIVRYVKAMKPDVVAFSSYLWNIERNLHLAELLRSSLPQALLLFGGPEISRHSFCLQYRQDMVDIFFAGEGEWFFRQFLAGDNLDSHTLTVNGNRLVTQPAGELMSVDAIVEPFTANMLNTMIDGSIFLELTRGCPYRCSYCYYSKNCQIVRELPFDLLLKALSGTREISEIYILSPTLDRSPDFKGKLKRLAAMNHSVSLHSELRASGVDRETAILLYKAGFRSMEVGLQTLNSDVLRRIRRGGNPEDELKGMLAMRDAGIDLKIGIIPGLPGETVDSFSRTVDLLVQNGFEDNIELYPLLILPGTAIRDQAMDEAILFQEKPPYFYLEGWGMNRNDIAAISSYTESRTGFSPTIAVIPDFTSGDKGLLIKGVRLDAEWISRDKMERFLNVIETSVFDFHVHTAGSEKLLKSLPDFLKLLPQNNLYNIIIYTDSIIDEDRLLHILGLCQNNTFHGRNNLFNSWAEAQPWRFYQVFSHPESYSRAFQQFSLIEPVLSLSSNSVEETRHFLNGLDPLEERYYILVLKGNLERYRDILRNLFLDSPELIAFEDMEEQCSFYHECGYEHLELPFSMKIMDLRR